MERVEIWGNQWILVDLNKVLPTFSTLLKVLIVNSKELTPRMYSNNVNSWHPQRFPEPLWMQRAVDNAICGPNLFSEVWGDHSSEWLLELSAGT